MSDQPQTVLDVLVRRFKEGTSESIIEMIRSELFGLRIMLVGGAVIGFLGLIFNLPYLLFD